MTLSCLQLVSSQHRFKKYLFDSYLICNWPGVAIGLEVRHEIKASIRFEITMLILLFYVTAEKISYRIVKI